MSSIRISGNLAALVILVLIGVSCSPARKAIREPLKQEGPQFLYTQLQGNKLTFNTFSTRASVDIRSSKTEMSLKAQIRIKKDSTIWISFSPLLGIEVVRLVLTPDSVKFLDRINRSYFCGNYSFFHDFYKVGFDYDMIESILLGVDFRCYDEGVMNAGIDHLLYRLSTANRRKIKRFVRSNSDSERVLLQDVWLDPQSFRIRKLKLQEANRDSRKLEAEYESLLTLANGDVVPHEITIGIKAEEEIKLKLNYNKVMINDPQTYPFSVPASYQAINFNGE